MKYDLDEDIIAAINQGAYIVIEKYQEMLELIELSKQSKFKPKIFLNVNHSEEFPENPEVINILREIKREPEKMELAGIEVGYDSNLVSPIIKQFDIKEIYA